MTAAEVIHLIAGIMLLFFLVYYKRSEPQGIDDKIIYFLMFCAGITLIII